ncbi:MAG: hypothetical protein E3J42_00545 [Dehalococcoidia bacterium]|nr:MAG: hypothetical protein E3J42_00545 [Dehalococcoidia bacterium]
MLTAVRVLPTRLLARLSGNGRRCASPEVGQLPLRPKMVRPAWRSYHNQARGINMEGNQGRRATPDEKLRVEEGTHSGAAISEVCRRHQIHHSWFHRWKRPEPCQGRQVHEATQADEVWHGPLGAGLVYAGLRDGQDNCRRPRASAGKEAQDCQG